MEFLGSILLTKSKFNLINLIPRSKLAERFNVYRMDENKQARERFLDRISQMPDLGVFNVCTKEYADEHFPRYFVL